MPHIKRNAIHPYSNKGLLPTEHPDQHGNYCFHTYSKQEILPTEHPEFETERCRFYSYKWSYTKLQSTSHTEFRAERDIGIFTNFAEEKNDNRQREL